MAKYYEIPLGLNDLRILSKSDSLNFMLYLRILSMAGYMITAVTENKINANFQPL